MRALDSKEKACDHWNNLDKEGCKAMKRALSPKAIGHLHIIMKKDICGGAPIIKGTRTSVANIAGYYLMGLSPEEIQRELPHLNPAQVYDAIAFYFDHKEMIDQDLEKDREELVSKAFPAGSY